MKKLVQITLCIILALSIFPMVAFASSELDANEKILIEKSETEITLDGTVIALPKEYVNMAKNHFLSNDVSVSDAQRDEILEYMDKAIYLVEQSNLSDLKKLPTSVKKEIVELATKSCESLSLTLNYDYSTETFSIVNSAGIVVAEGDKVIKKTGLDVSPVVYLSMSVIFILLACFVISKKFILFAQR